MLIYNGNIVTMEKTDFPNGFVEIKDGKIVALGDMKDCPKPTESDLDAKGQNVLPAFIDAHSHLGVWENGLGFEGDDGNEETDPSTPQLRAIDMINPNDLCFSEAAAAGVATVVSGVGSANPVGGSLLIMKTAGSKRIDKLIIKEPAAIKFALGENPKRVYSDRDETPITRMATAGIIRETLYKAKRYAEDMARYEETKDTDDETDPPEYDIKCEALLPLLRREIKAHFHCHRADDIFTAIRLSKEFNLDYVLIHATSGAEIADELAEEKPFCVIGPVICDRGKPELKAHSIKTAAALTRAGITVSICTDHPEVPIQYLPLSAGLAVRGGMTEREALAAITINPAKTVGIDNRVGSLAKGKDADIVIFKGKFYDVTETPTAVFIDGKEVV